MSSSDESPMLDGGGRHALHGSDLANQDEGKPYVGVDDPDGPMNTGQTGALARSEHKRRTGDTTHEP
jgi:hypothetical protein